MVEFVAVAAAGVELLSSVVLPFPVFVVSELRPLHSHNDDVENGKCLCQRNCSRPPDEDSGAP